MNCLIKIEIKSLMIGKFRFAFEGTTLKFSWFFNNLIVLMYSSNFEDLIFAERGRRWTFGYYTILRPRSYVQTVYSHKTAIVFQQISACVRIAQNFCWTQYLKEDEFTFEKFMCTLNIHGISPCMCNSKQFATLAVITTGVGLGYSQFVSQLNSLA